MWFNPGTHCWAHWYSFPHVRFSPPELQRSRAWAAQHGGAGSPADHNGDYKTDKNCKQLAPLTPIGKNKSSKTKTRLFRSCALKMFVDDRNLASYNETGCPATPNIPKSRLVFYLERYQLPTSSEWRCERSVGSWRAHQSLHRSFSPTGQCHLGQLLLVLRPHRLPRSPPSSRNQAAKQPPPPRTAPARTQRQPSGVPCRRPQQKSCWTPTVCRSSLSGTLAHGISQFSSL